MTKRLGVTEVVLRDAHQSLLATRFRLEDMLPICPELDQVGFWSLEVWGGATFDACIRYLGEDPWERLRAFKQALPNTPLQMLLRGQNLLGYRHYGDDVVDAFVERAAAGGIDVFHVFDALNDLRNIEHAVKAVIASGKHAQGTMSYYHQPGTYHRHLGRLGPADRGSGRSFGLHQGHGRAPQPACGHRIGRPPEENPGHPRPPPLPCHHRAQCRHPIRRCRSWDRQHRHGGLLDEHDLQP